MTDSPKPPAEKKPSNWIFPIGGGLVGAYFLIKGAFSVRETQGDVIFALLMAGIVVLLGGLGFVMYRTWRADRNR
ncbi:hypothetical protein [Actinoplanes couchii]|uniref:hypothetical protein n=1 Tax=Actinoplanes couchii TaxID=403638 RepID=UPI001944FEC5|nr:hypothetical protein [Actinoplanes couchii]MDR6316089.1 hypothetical protein [Actinoplanes couchii]